MTTQIYVRDPKGIMLTTLSNFIKLEYARAENKVGWLKLDLDPSQADPAIFGTPNLLDYRLEPWRTVQGMPPYLDGETVFFIRKWGYKIDTNGKETYHIECVDAPDILNSRIIKNLKDGYAKFTNKEADDALKDIVRYNLGSSVTDSKRDLSAYLSVQADLSLAPKITKDGSIRSRPVPDVMDEICADSFSQPTDPPSVYLARDIVYTSPTMLEFRTYINARGDNHGGAKYQPAQMVDINRERGNFETPEFVEDHTQEKNFIYARGPGSDGTFMFKTAELDSSIGLSPFNRRELHVNATMTVTQNALQHEANAALIQNKRKKTLAGRIVDTDGCLYGVHYKFGDIVVGEYRGFAIDAHVNAIHVTVENGKEVLDNQLKAEI